MKKLHSARQGFTLIELLIVSSITLIVVAAAIASLTTFQARQRALVAAKDVQQLMWSAQTKARVREVPTGATCANPSNPLRGYYVSVQLSGANLYAVCGAAAPVIITGHEVTYPDGVRANAGTGNYMFHTLERGVSFKSGTLTPVPGPLLETSAPTSWNFIFCTTSGSGCDAASPSFGLSVGSLGWVSGITSSFIGTVTNTGAATE